MLSLYINDSDIVISDNSLYYNCIFPYRMAENKSSFINKRLNSYLMQQNLRTYN